MSPQAIVVLTRYYHGEATESARYGKRLFAYTHYQTLAAIREATRGE